MAINNLQDMKDILSANNIEISDSAAEHLFNDYNSVMNSDIVNVDDKTVVMEHLTTEILMEDTISDKMDEVDQEDSYVNGIDYSGYIDDEKHTIIYYSYELRSVSNAIEDFIEKGTGSVSNGPVDFVIAQAEDGKYTVEISAEEELQELDSIMEFNTADDAISELINNYSDAERSEYVFSYDSDLIEDTFNEGFEEKTSNVISAINESVSETDADKIDNGEQDNSDDVKMDDDVVFESPFDFDDIIKGAIDDYKEQAANDISDDDRNVDTEENQETSIDQDTMLHEAYTGDLDDIEEDDGYWDGVEGYFLDPDDSVD